MWSTEQTAAASQRTLPTDWGKFGRYLNGLRALKPDRAAVSVTMLFARSLPRDLPLRLFKFGTRRPVSASGTDSFLQVRDGFRVVLAAPAPTGFAVDFSSHGKFFDGALIGGIGRPIERRLAGGSRIPAMLIPRALSSESLS